jgi:AmpE protein
MRLIVLIISVAMERWLDVGDKLRNYAWYNHYIKLLHKYVGSTALWRGWLGVATILLPVLVVVLLLSLILNEVAYEIGGLLLNIAILFYCLGPINLQQQITRIIDAFSKEDTEALQREAATLLPGEVPEQQNALVRAIAQQIFVAANQRLFAVLFWFIVLGPYGAVLYRFITLLHDTAQSAENPCQEMGGPCKLIIQALDWIPARLLSLTLALAGNFDAVMGKLISRLAAGLDSSTSLLTDSGLAAMNLHEVGSEQAEPKEVVTALDIINRCLLTWAVVYSIIMVTAWLF